VKAEGGRALAEGGIRELLQTRRNCVDQLTRTRGFLGANLAAADSAGARAGLAWRAIMGNMSIHLNKHRAGGAGVWREEIQRRQPKGSNEGQRHEGLISANRRRILRAAMGDLSDFWAMQKAETRRAEYQRKTWSCWRRGAACYPRSKEKPADPRKGHNANGKRD